MGLKSFDLTRIPRKHPVKTSLAAPFLLSAAIQLTPQIASAPSEEYLHDNDYPEALSAHFNTDNIRVYDRWSPLSAMHFMGRPVGQLTNNYPDEWGDAAWSTVTAPFEMLVLTFFAVGQYVLPSDINAYAVPDHDGTCFVRPPAQKVDLDDALSGLSGLSEIEDEDRLAVKGNIEDIEDAFRTIIMAHEMRHCEQPGYATVENMRESDADIVALQLLLDAGYEREVIEEVYKLYLAARLVAGRRDAESHDTGMNILSGNTVSLSSYKNLASQRVLHDLVEMSLPFNEFPDEMGDDEKNVHMIIRLSHSDVLHEFDPEVSEYALAYTQAYLYLNRVANGSLFDYPDYFSKLNVNFASYATGTYAPDYHGLDLRF